jgi:hypothetical protein
VRAKLYDEPRIWADLAFEQTRATPSLNRRQADAEGRRPFPRTERLQPASAACRPDRRIRVESIATAGIRLNPRPCLGFAAEPCTCPRFAAPRSLNPRALGGDAGDIGKGRFPKAVRANDIIDAIGRKARAMPNTLPMKDAVARGEEIERNHQAGRESIAGFDRPKERVASEAA